MDGGSEDHAGAAICRQCGRPPQHLAYAQFARNGELLQGATYRGDCRIVSVDAIIRPPR